MIDLAIQLGDLVLLLAHECIDFISGGFQLCFDNIDLLDV